MSGHQYNPDFDFFSQDHDEDDSPRRTRRHYRQSTGGGSTALICGILGLFLLWPLGIAAIFIGNAALRDDPNDNNAYIGVVLGWVCILLLILGVFFGCLFFGSLMRLAGR